VQSLKRANPDSTQPHGRAQGPAPRRRGKVICAISPADGTIYLFSFSSVPSADTLSRSPSETPRTKQIPPSQFLHIRFAVPCHDQRSNPLRHSTCRVPPTSVSSPQCTHPSMAAATEGQTLLLTPVTTVASAPRCFCHTIPASQAARYPQRHITRCSRLFSSRTPDLASTSHQVPYLNDNHQCSLSKNIPVAVDALPGVGVPGRGSRWRAVAATYS
jgi:hypothetical protein